MKRFILPTVFFYLCTFTALSPVRVFASTLPALSIIAETQVGEAMVQELAVDRILKMVDPPKPSATPPFTVPTSATTALSGLVAGSSAMAGIAFYARTGRDPVYAAASAVASAADVLFVPAYQAFKANFVSPETFPASAAQYVGLESSVGAKIGDIVNHVKASSAELYTNLRGILSANTAAVYPDSSFVPGSIFSFPWGNFKANSNAAYQYYGDMSLAQFFSNVVPASYVREYITDTDSVKYIAVSANSTAVNGSIYKLTPATNGNWSLYVGYNLTRTPSAPTASPVDQINYSGIKSALQSPSPAVAKDIKEAVKNIPEDKKIVSSDPAPSAVPAPSQTAITNEQVNNFFTQNTSNVFNEYNNVANNTESTYNDIEAAKAAAELAKEQEEDKKEEETFPPVASSAFEEPYDPGPYDIPERFSSFLNTVKSSGLFSFSASFFNSLPGGGSPVYEIEGGQYGHHTIDLSQTLSGGLAVLKTVLLALFGFLSIRAVIMKR